MTGENATFQYFEVFQNSDMTEGRGPMKAVGQFTTLEAAVEDAKGRGVMGFGDGEVEEVNLYVKDTGRIIVERFKVYGFVRNDNGDYTSGYLSEWAKKQSRRVSVDESQM